MADIISFLSDPHQAIEMLIPWYAIGKLNDQDRATVDAHLGSCAQCRAALERERRLKAEIAQLPIRADLGWEKLQRRLAPDQTAKRSLPNAWRTLTWPALAAFAAAQAVLLCAAVLLFWPAAPQADYRTLGAPSSRGSGNLIIMFRPDTLEQEMRFTLHRAGARLVDGPTAAGAYVLDVAPAQRDAALADLRTRRSVMLVQPIGPGQGR
ncbi:zf-HC2 domain-containing protein [Rhizorhabdus argentea]|uniref:zf-HC2 domain-containing protein n=1 Tax=Rhizorhabdus argentea TaxID=1387174 RepID=UPI0030EC5B77